MDNENGYDSDGYDENGYDRGGYDRGGYDRGGYDSDGYDEDGYDEDGYDENGYDRDGYDRGGYDRGGYDCDGYDENGYDRGGYDASGYDSEGYDGNGYDENGYDSVGRANPETPISFDFSGTYGVELEYEISNLDAHICGYVRKMDNVAEVVSDGSLDTDRGLEIVSHVLNADEMRDFLFNICGQMREYNAVAYDSGHSCGAHFNLSRKLLNHDQWRIFQHYVCSSLLLEKTAKRKSYQYCERNHDYMSDLERSKDRAVAFYRDRVEVRLCGCTTKHQRLIKFFDLIINLVNECKKISEQHNYSDIDIELLDSINIDYLISADRQLQLQLKLEQNQCVTT